MKNWPHVVNHNLVRIGTWFWGSNSLMRHIPWVHFRQNFKNLSEINWFRGKVSFNNWATTNFTKFTEFLSTLSVCPSVCGSYSVWLLYVGSIVLHNLLEKSTFLPQSCTYLLSLSIMFRDSVWRLRMPLNIAQVIKYRHWKRWKQQW